MQVGRAHQQRQHARNRLRLGELQQCQQAKADQRRQNIDQDVGGISNDHVAHAGIVSFVFVKDRQLLDVGPHHIGRKHQQRLTHAVPRVDSPIAPAQPEVRVIPRDHRRGRSPEGVGGLQPPGCINRIQIARLHDKRNQPRRHTQQEEWIAQPCMRNLQHRCDTNPTGAGPQMWIACQERIERLTCENARGNSACRFRSPG